MAVWRDNETLTYITPFRKDDSPEDFIKMLILSFPVGDERFTLLSSPSACAVAEIAEFLVAPSRHVCFDVETLSVEQSVVLATRLHSVQLTFEECTFEDKGNAFVNALQRSEVIIWLLDVV